MANSLGLPFWIIFLSSPFFPDKAPGCELKDGEITGILGAPTLTNGQKAVFQMVVYVNGQNTTADEALKDTAVVAQSIGCGVRLIYDDLTLPVIDWFSTAIEKIGGADTSVNTATDTLIKTIRGQIECGGQIHVIGHSAGSIVILNAVRAIAEEYERRSVDERKLLLSRIHVLTVGGATFSEENVFSDGWPEIGSIHHLWDSRDGVCNVWGEGDFFDWFDCDLGDYHTLNPHYTGSIKPTMLQQSGRTVIGP